MAIMWGVLVGVFPNNTYILSSYAIFVNSLLILYKNIDPTNL